MGLEWLFAYRVGRMRRFLVWRVVGSDEAFLRLQGEGRRWLDEVLAFFHLCLVHVFADEVG